MSKIAVLVVGAPRSGTSALSHLMAELGVYFGEPERFVDPSIHTHNPIFYELVSLNKLNDQILEELGHVFGHFDYFPIESEPVVGKHRSFVGKAKSLVANELSSRQIIGLKDPRFVFTLPLWEAALLELGYVVKIVIAHRNVDEVVRSNLKVNKGTSEPYNRRIAMISQALVAHRVAGRDYLVVHYDDLVESPRIQAQKIAGWLGLEQSAIECAANVIQANLRHQQSTGLNPNIMRSHIVETQAEEYRSLIEMLERYGILELIETQAKSMRGQLAYASAIDQFIEKREVASARLEESLRQRIGELEADNMQMKRKNMEQEDAMLDMRSTLLQRIIGLEENTKIIHAREAARISSELNVSRSDISKLEEQFSSLEAHQFGFAGKLDSIQRQCEHNRADITELHRQQAVLVPLHRKIGWYYRAYGLKALLRRALLGRAGNPEVVNILPTANNTIGVGQAPDSATVIMPSAEHGDGSSDQQTQDVYGLTNTIPARTLIRERFSAIQALPVCSESGSEARLNLVTDSINKGSLFGGVGTAIILAAFMAKDLGAKLRVVTRTESPDREGFWQVLECNGIRFDLDVEFDYVAQGDDQAFLSICEGDRFLTTSWWTTACVLGSIPASKVSYLLQEDERMFYPNGDDQLRCRETLARSDIKYVINTKLLYQHLIDSGLSHLSECAVWFEPAFPVTIFNHEQAKGSGRKRRLFFYARPNNLRNLFYRGIEVLEAAVSENLITSDAWEIYMVGKDVPAITLGDGIKPKVLASMGWKSYGELIRSIDLGFCLMDTPHPSYPPLDLAASGAVVLTNKFGLKSDLHKYSDNIFCSDLDVRALLASLREAIERVENDDARQAAYRSSRLERSWQETMSGAVKFLSED